MSRAEVRWCLAFAALLAVGTSIPYALGYQSAGDEWVFTGFVFGVEDGNSYIAKMLAGASGAWLFQTPYSSHSTAPVLAFLPYLVLGKLAAGAEIHLQLTLLFHGFRLAVIPLAVLAMYRFASAFIQEIPWRRWTTILGIAGGGLGWLLAALGGDHVFGSLPLDFISPETFGFLSVYGLPHLLLSRALLLFVLAIVFEVPPRRRAGWIAGGGLLLMALAQPLTLIPAYAGLAAWLLTEAVAGRSERGLSRTQAWRAVGLAVVISLPALAYYGLGALVDPGLRQWTSQNLLPSPHPVHYLFAYGLVLVPAGIGLRAGLASQDRGVLSLAVWVALLLCLAYVPVSVQRRLVDGAWPALITLAAVGLKSIPRGPGHVTVPRVVFLGSLGTTALLLLGGAWSVAVAGIPFHRPAGEVRAMSALGELTPVGAVVLSSFETGNVLPAFLPVRTVVGHGPETANLAALLPQVESFFGQRMSDHERASFLAEQAVDFVFVGPQERALGGWSSDPAMLEARKSIGEYAIYQVRGR